MERGGRHGGLGGARQMGEGLLALRAVWLQIGESLCHLFIVYLLNCTR